MELSIMDFRRFDRVLKQSTASNSTVNLTNLSPNILEAFIPGYGIISNIIQERFGFDIGVIVTTALLCFATISGVKYFWKNFYSSFRDSFMSYIVIDGKDDLFRNVLAWASEQQMTKRSRRLNAVTHNSTAQEDEAASLSADDYISADGLFHFGKWAAKKPPRYEPAIGTHWFIFEKRLFIFVRSDKERRSQPWQGIEEHRLDVRCIGRSTEPLKRWIEAVKIWAVEKETSFTTIKRPTGPNQRRAPGHWSPVTSRPSRPMSTVVLDPQQKARLVADVNEYLHPATPKWYATRGIPYRRGYLFHGPPGTGKSSLSFALAGLFGLDIHVVSLNEQGLNAITESELIMLFNNLPRRCIVLLEDIDTAGLSRDAQSDDAQRDRKNEAENKENLIADLARELKKEGRRGRLDDASKQGISLSGLLNAIDGVASHEGRVLIMTTNHPEALDKALIRPGRVDMQIAFTLATRHQAKEIFIRMFEDENAPRVSPTVATKIVNGEETPAAADAGAKNEKQGYTKLKQADMTPPPTPKAPSMFAGLILEPELPLSAEELSEMGDQFADLLPEDRFSPAEIQSFLITRKKRPRQALKDTQEWRDDLIATKKQGTRVLGAQ